MYPSDQYFTSKLFKKSPYRLLQKTFWRRDFDPSPLTFLKIQKKGISLNFKVICRKIYKRYEKTKSISRGGATDGVSNAHRIMSIAHTVIPVGDHLHCQGNGIFENTLIFPFKFKNLQ